MTKAVLKGTPEEKKNLKIGKHKADRIDKFIPSSFYSICYRGSTDP